MLGSAGSPTVIDAIAVRQCVHELVLTRLRHQDPAERVAHLAAVGEAGHLNSGGGDRGVGVVEHDCRRLAAKFEAHLLESRGTGKGYLPTGRRRSGERDLVDTGVAHQLFTDFATSGHHVQDARRKVGLSARSASSCASSTDSGAGLSTTEHPASSAGTILHDGEELRHVPRHHRGDNPHRLLHDPDVLAVQARTRLLPLVAARETTERRHDGQGKADLRHFGESDGRADLG